MGNVVFLMNTRFIILVFLLLLTLASVYFATRSKGETSSGELKLYWFIPDGFRAEPDLFNIYKWAEEGKLPNIKKLMDSGSYGYSIPDYPSHTPVNFATLMTGSHPKTHKVSDGPMRLEGYPLKVVPISGFKSTSKKVPPMWFTLERNNMYSLLLSMPGSTPPELSDGITIRGRWGGWGADFNAINFQESSLKLPGSDKPRAAQLLYAGADLHKETVMKPAFGWDSMPVSYSEAKEATLEGWDKKIYIYIHDATDDKTTNYDSVAFSYDKKSHIATLKEGEWSGWLPITLKWQTRNDYNAYTPKKSELERKYTALGIDTEVKIKLIKLEDSGSFRIRFLYNNLNEYITKPGTVAEELTKGVGPMVDFVDNFPPQLIYFPEDKSTFLEEAEMSLDWHRDAVSFLVDTYKPEAVFHNIYTPNQMLTSRWWLGYIDPKSKRYGDVSDGERDKLWSEVKWMYKKIDDIVGEIMGSADENTVIVLSSDHGAAPLDKEVRINNFFAKHGLLKYKINKDTRIPEIDWDKTTAVFLRMDNIYIDPKGLGGNWKRAKGEDYEELRDKIIGILEDLKDEDGTSPVSLIVKWENVEDYLNLPKERVGDLIIANEVGYHWDEEITQDGEVFSVPLKSGYKQAILPENEKSVWTPFIIAGPGIKRGYRIEEPIHHIDQYPTIMELLGEDIPSFVEGEILSDIFAE